MKIKPCLDEYLEYLAVHRHLSPLTVAANRRDLENFIQALPGQETHSIATIEELEIRAYLMQRSAQGAAAQSLARYRSHLKNFFAYCLQQYPELLVSNPVELVSTPKIKRTLPEVLDVHTLLRLLDIPTNS